MTRQFNIDPIYKDVPRTWRDRLFTIPWRPLQATRQERDFSAEHDAYMERLEEEIDKRNHHVDRAISNEINR